MDAVTLRTVERFPEPQFSGLVDQLLHDPDRRAVGERFLRGEGGPPTPTTAQQLRVGAFAGEQLVGWSHAYLGPGGQLYVANSAVLPPWRRQGIYTRLVAAVEREALALGCVRVESHHRTGNVAVLIAKLKAGYLITGTEFTAEMGLLVKMAKSLSPARQAVFEARADSLAASARFFGPPPG